MPLFPGTQMNTSISFNAPNANVTAVGMRFGDTGPISFAPINTGGARSGTGSFDFELTPEICLDLASICHHIRCYEFALTDAGKISAANTQEVTLICRDCNEPSCQDFVDPADCSETPSGEGHPGFYLTWNNVNQNIDLRVYFGAVADAIGPDTESVVVGQDCGFWQL